MLDPRKITVGNIYFTKSRGDARLVFRKAVNDPSSSVMTEHACRAGCGACCIAPSISSPIPGMPGGKPAGVRCVQLDEHERCRIFGRPERPACCSGLQPEAQMCGASRGEALTWLTRLEVQTRPDR